jgi:hypothetical protein
MEEDEAIPQRGLAGIDGGCARLDEGADALGEGRVGH